VLRRVLVFFQAEDGIRVFHVTGVQTCALPILIVRTSVQQLYVDGYTTQDDADAQTIWGIWQANRWDARQIGLHRSVSTYGVAYGTALPGQPVPVLKAHSPRTMTAASGNDTTWPLYALQEMPDGTWRL